MHLLTIIKIQNVQILTKFHSSCMKRFDNKYSLFWPFLIINGSHATAKWSLVVTGDTSMGKKAKHDCYSGVLRHNRNHFSWNLSEVCLPNLKETWLLTLNSQRWKNEIYTTIFYSTVHFWPLILYKNCDSVYSKNTDLSSYKKINCVHALIYS